MDEKDIELLKEHKDSIEAQQTIYNQIAYFYTTFDPEGILTRTHRGMTDKEVRRRNRYKIFDPDDMVGVDLSEGAIEIPDMIQWSEGLQEIEDWFTTQEAAEQPDSEHTTTQLADGIDSTIQQGEDLNMRSQTDNHHGRLTPASSFALSDFLNLDDVTMANQDYPAAGDEFTPVSVDNQHIAPSQHQLVFETAASTDQMHDTVLEEAGTESKLPDDEIMQEETEGLSSSNFRERSISTFAGNPLDTETASSRRPVTEPAIFSSPLKVDDHSSLDGEDVGTSSRPIELQSSVEPAAKKEPGEESDYEDESPSSIYSKNQATPKSKTPANNVKASRSNPKNNKQLVDVYVHRTPKFFDQFTSKKALQAYMAETYDAWPHIQAFTGFTALKTQDFRAKVLEWHAEMRKLANRKTYSASRAAKKSNFAVTAEATAMSSDPAAPQHEHDSDVSIVKSSPLKDPFNAPADTPLVTSSLNDKLFAAFAETAEAKASETVGRPAAAPSALKHRMSSLGPDPRPAKAPRRSLRGQSVPDGLAAVGTGGMDDGKNECKEGKAEKDEGEIRGRGGSVASRRSARFSGAAAPEDHL